MMNRNAQQEPLFGVGELAPEVLAAYAHLWQFETWLRRLVYVQLRALDGDSWESKMACGWQGSATSPSCATWGAASRRPA